MKLLFLIHSLASGGAERVVATLASHWTAQGWQVTVLTVAPKRMDFYEIHPDVTRLALDLETSGPGLANRIWNNLRRVLAVRKVLRSASPDVAIAMMPEATVVLAVAALANRGLITIGSERNHPPQSRRPGTESRLRNWAYARMSAIVALTSETATWLRANTKSKRVEVIPNAADAQLGAQEPIVPPHSIAPANSRMLLGVGRLTRQKGFDILIDGFAEIAVAHPDWCLVILGEGEDRESLESSVKGRNLEARVFLPGRAGNMGDWYAAADGFCLSSRYEGFPNVLAEAMAHGLPAVAFDCETGPRDLVRPEVDGLLVENGDREALTDALDRLMGDEYLRRRLAQQAPEVRTRYALDRIAKRWEMLFGELR